MSVQKQSLFKAVLARISLGAVPVDGPYWFDPKEAGTPAPSKREPVPEADWSPVSLSLFRSIRRR